MSDMRKSRFLRIFLFVIATLVLWMAVAIIDDGVVRINQHLFGEAVYKSQVEGMVFIWVTSSIIWRWLSRRVWIGSASLTPTTEGTK